MEIPIIMGVEGEAQEIIESYGAGLCFKPEDETDFNEKLNALLNDKNLYEKCKQGCRQLSIDFDRKKLAQKMLDIIES